MASACLKGGMSLSKQPSLFEQTLLFLIWVACNFLVKAHLVSLELFKLFISLLIPCYVLSVYEKY